MGSGDRKWAAGCREAGRPAAGTQKLAGSPPHHGPLLPPRDGGSPLPQGTRVLQVAENMVAGSSGGRLRLGH